MEQNKDQSGAITLERAGFKLASHVATPGGPIMASVTDVYEKDGIQLVHSYAMGGESWSVGAAVRGEAVAESKSISLSVAILTIPYPEHVDQLGNNEWVLAYKKGHQDARNSAAAVAAAVSARAADAPSEPSELGDWTIMQICAAFPGMARSNSMSEIIGFANAVRTFGMKSRAADALDSQPGTDEPTEREALIACLGDDAVTLLRANPDDEMAQTMREAAAMLENDGKALDSQPTGPVADVQARVRDAVAENLRGLYYCGRVWSAWSVGTMGEDDFSPAEEDDNIIANITDAVMAVLSPASSQPTEPWTRTEDRLPPVETPVFILHSDDVKIGEIRWENPSYEETFEAFMYWDDPNDDGQSWDWLEVTHWMLIPPAPASSQPTDGGVRNG